MERLAVVNPLCLLVCQLLSEQSCLIWSQRARMRRGGAAPDQQDQEGKQMSCLHIYLFHGAIQSHCVACRCFGQRRLAIDSCRRFTPSRRGKARRIVGNKGDPGPLTKSISGRSAGVHAGLECGRAGILGMPVGRPYGLSRRGRQRAGTLSPTLGVLEPRFRPVGPQQCSARRVSYSVTAGYMGDGNGKRRRKWANGARTAPSLR